MATDSLNGGVCSSCGGTIFQEMKFIVKPKVVGNDERGIPYRMAEDFRYWIYECILCKARHTYNYNLGTWNIVK
jgi:hypothetical protein